MINARLLQVGEIVASGDYMQIGDPPHVGYHPVVTMTTCGLKRQAWHGDSCGPHGGAGFRIEHTGQRYWRKNTKEQA